MSLFIFGSWQTKRYWKRQRGFVALLSTWWTWVWVNSRSWWWTGRPGMLRFMGSQRVGHNWATELNWTVYSQIPHKCVAHLTFICVMPSKVQWQLIQSIIKLYHCQQLTQSHRIQESVQNTFLYSMTELYLPTQKFRGVTRGLNATQLTAALLKKWLHGRERSWWNSPSLFCSKDLHSERIQIWANKTWSTYLSVILSIHHFTHLINIRMKKPECRFSDLGNGKGVSVENQINRV